MLLSPALSLELPILPIPLTPVVGRERDLRTILDWLADPARRLVTLTGPGGVGKTRLALAISAEIAGDAVTAGVAFVDLSAITTPSLVMPTVAHAVGIPADADAGPALAGAIERADLLLVLDNLEQVVDAAPDIAWLLGRCPNLTILATSRTTLRLSGEHDYPVQPLALPNGNGPLTLAGLQASAAGRLFLQRARSAQPGDEPFTDADAGAIAAICARVDGLPLAIELAAARTKVLTPRALLNRLDRRLPLLTGGPRDLPGRQQTLRATILWSDDLLRPEERILFHRLGVFVGGFTLQAVEVVAASRGAGSGGSGPDGAEPTPVIPTEAVLDGLELLIGHSLIRRVDDDEAEPRYAMLETVREFAGEQLVATGERDMLRSRHADYFREMAERAKTAYYGPDQTTWLDRVEREHDNIRAALGWYVERGDAGAALAFAANLWRFWEVRGYLAEGRGWLERALALPGDVRPALRATALNNLGNLLYRLSDFGRARELYEESLAIYREHGDSRDHADTLNNLGLVASVMGDYDLARTIHDESLALRRADGDRWRLSLGLHNAGENLVDANQPGAARELLDAALAIRTELGDRRGAAYVEYNLGRAAAALGDAGAEPLIARSLDGFREATEKIGMADALTALARLRLDVGRHADAPTLLAEAIRLRLDMGDRRGTVAVLDVVVRLAAERGRPERAARLAGFADAERAVLGTPVPAVYRAANDALLATLRTSLTPDGFTAAWIDGRGGGLAGAIDDLLDEVVQEGGPAGTAARAGAAPAGDARRGDVAGDRSDSGLTPREIDVLVLVAQGLGDREIADRLGIGQRTVSSHVTNILNKLGLPSRAAAAAQAVRLGLA